MTIPATFAMRIPGPAASGNVVTPNGTAVSVTDGLALVPLSDVTGCLRVGWSLQPGQQWPVIKHMKPPSDRATTAWPTDGTVTAPDGQSIAVTGGVALVPIDWVNWYEGHGWKEVLA